MSAPTSTVLRALAQAGDKGLAHLAAQQNTGTWISRCGRQVRGRDIRSWTGEPAGARALELGAGFCADCRRDALAAAGSIVDGVAVLLEQGIADDSAPQLLDVPLSAIRTDGPQRTADAGLVHSVHEHGVLQPIVLRRTPAGLQLVAGGRRLAAAALAGLGTVPAIVRDRTVEEAMVDALAENLHRTDLDPIAQATAYAAALERLGCSKEALADRVGVSRSQVSNTIRLLALPEALREQVASGALSAAHARELLRVEDQADQVALAAQIVAEGLSVRETVARRAAGEQLADVAALLGSLLDARVRVSAGAERARITIELAGGELPRVLTQLGLRAG